jgi:hypothetical protein
MDQTDSGPLAQTQADGDDQTNGLIEHHEEDRWNDHRSGEVDDLGRTALANDMEKRLFMEAHGSGGRVNGFEGAIEEEMRSFVLTSGDQGSKHFQRRRPWDRLGWVIIGQFFQLRP